MTPGSTWLFSVFLHIIQNSCSTLEHSYSDHHNHARNKTCMICSPLGFQNGQSFPLCPQSRLKRAMALPMFSSRNINGSLETLHFCCHGNQTQLLSRHIPCQAVLSPFRMLNMQPEKAAAKLLGIVWPILVQKWWLPSDCQGQ